MKTIFLHIGLLYLFLKYVFPFISCFICAFLLSSIIYHIQNKNHYKNILLTCLFLILFTFGLIFLIFQLYLFLKQFYLYYPSLLKEIQYYLTNQQNEIISYLLLLLKNILPFLTNLILLFPKSISFIFFTLILSILFSFDMDHIQNQITLYPTIHKYYLKIQSTLLFTLKTILFSMLKLSLITWIICLIGFIIIQVKHALFLSIIIGLFDFLPILGAGTIFIPYIIYSYITNDPKALSLLILYLIIALIRFMIEPKIMSHQLDIPLLLHLFMLFLCTQLFGFIGALYAPILSIFLVLWYKDWQVK
ncbi:MAG: AI-2E family transporter [Traorella sp.]